MTCKQAIPNMEDVESNNERLSRRKPSPSESQRRSTSLYLPAPAPARKPKLIIMIHSFQQTRTQNHQHPGSSPPDVNHNIFHRHRHPLLWPWAVALPLPCPCLSCTWLVPPCPLPQIKEATAVNSVIRATSLAVTLFSRHFCSEWGLRISPIKTSSRVMVIEISTRHPLSGCFTDRLSSHRIHRTHPKCSSNRHFIIN